MVEEIRKTKAIKEHYRQLNVAWLNDVVERILALYRKEEEEKKNEA